MYIDLEYLSKKELSPNELVCLVAIKQGFKKLINEDYLEKFSEQGFIKYVKGKKDSQLVDLVRLDKKGKDLLVRLSYAGVVDEETDRLSAWLMNVYKNKEGGFVKNKAEFKRRLHWFKTITKIEGNFLAILINLSLQDMYDVNCGVSYFDYKKDNPRTILSNLGENLFFRPDSHFDKHYTLDKSPLYTYYEDNIEHVEASWEQHLDADGNRKIK